MTEQIDIVAHLITVSPALGVLVWMVIYFRGQIKEKDERIKELSDELRERDRDSIQFISDLNNTLKNLR